MTETQTYLKLVPEPTPESAGYWQGLNEERLLLQECAECSAVRHYPRPMCPVCHSMEFNWTQSSGRGVLHSWTISHHAFHPGFREDLPYTLATVDLAEGVRMNAQLRGAAPESLRIGLPVRVAFERVKPGLTLPYLVPDSAV